MSAVDKLCNAGVSAVALFSIRSSAVAILTASVAPVASNSHL